jgi:hypothetical protein
MSFYLKDPQSRVDYGIDWTGYLGPQTLTGSLWSVTPEEVGGIAIDASSFDLLRTAATLSGGLDGHVYTVSNLATFSDGRRDQRSICLRVEQR